MTNQESIGLMILRLGSTDDLSQSSLPTRRRTPIQSGIRFRLPLRCAEATLSKTGDQVVHKKSRYFRKILEMGYDVMASDIDMIWLKNPFTIMNDHRFAPF